MAKTQKAYTRLPGSGRSGMRRTRLWLGPDHLLLVGSSSIGERYKRFYFADIQAIVCRKTGEWLISGIILLMLAVGTGIPVLEIHEFAGRVTVLSVAGIFLLFLVIHAARGPTCRCSIRTAVQTEFLSTLRRVRTLNKVLARIRPLIAAAQAPKSTETPAQP